MDGGVGGCMNGWVGRWVCGWMNGWMSGVDWVELTRDYFLQEVLLVKF